MKKLKEKLTKKNKKKIDDSKLLEILINIKPYYGFLKTWFDNHLAISFEDEKLLLLTYYLKDLYDYIFID